MNTSPLSISPRRHELLAVSLTGIVPAACDAEAGVLEEVVFAGIIENRISNNRVSLGVGGRRSGEGDEELGDENVTG
jgi:hypothetical protein